MGRRFMSGGTEGGVRHMPEAGVTAVVIQRMRLTILSPSKITVIAMLVMKHPCLDYLGAKRSLCASPTKPA